MLVHQFGARERPLFGMFAPARVPRRRAAVLLLQPVGWEYIRAHRTMRTLAHRFAAEGVDAFRFDYSGTGDSWGDASEEMSLSQWRADIDDAIEELLGLAGVAKVSVVGLRVGATLALETACRRPRDIDCVLAWDPLPAASDVYQAPVRPDDRGTLALNPRLEEELATLSFRRPTTGKVSIQLVVSDDVLPVPDAVKESADQIISVPDSPVCWMEEQDFGAGAVPAELLNRIVRGWTA